MDPFDDDLFCDVVAARFQTAIRLTVSWTWALPGPSELLRIGLWPLASQLIRSSRVLMPVQFLVRVTARSNKVAFPESDIFKQSRGLIGISFLIAIVLQGPGSPFGPQSACITVSVILQ
jgi:hypothetical protein